jgi:hypothetical protein
MITFRYWQIDKAIPKGWKRGLLSHHHGANGFCYIYRSLDD